MIEDIHTGDAVYFLPIREPTGQIKVNTARRVVVDYNFIWTSNAPLPTASYREEVARLLPQIDAVFDAEKLGRRDVAGRMTETEYMSWVAQHNMWAALNESLGIITTPPQLIYRAEGTAQLV